jgi:hypothetical protein
MLCYDVLCYDKVLAEERPRIASTMPHALCSLVKRAWQHDAPLRPTFEALLPSLAQVEEALPAGTDALGIGSVDDIDDFAALR